MDFAHVHRVLFLFFLTSAALAFTPARNSPLIESHPLYVTVTEFNLNSKEKLLEISCKIFVDDLEAALKNQNKVAVDISNPKDAKALDKMIADYCQKHLRIKINGIAVAIQFLGFEKEAEAAWCYLQVNGVNAIKKLEVTNSLLFELYDSEISIMHASVGGLRKSTKLVNPATQAVFEWQ